MGILGALLLATNSSISKYGWLAFLASNIARLVFAVVKRLRMLLLQQLAFSCTSMIGIFNAFLA